MITLVLIICINILNAMVIGGISAVSGVCSHRAMKQVRVRQQISIPQTQYNPQHIQQQSYEDMLINGLQSDIINGVSGYYILKLQGGEWVPMFRYDNAIKARIVMNEYRETFKCQMIIKHV